MEGVPKTENSTELLCRTCMETENLVPIFNDVDRHETYSKALYITTGLEIKLGDKLSQMICDKCIESLKNALDFREKSRMTEKVLIKMLDGCEVEKTSKKNKKSKRQSDNEVTSKDLESDIKSEVIKYELSEIEIVQQNETEIVQQKVEKTEPDEPIKPENYDDSRFEDSWDQNDWVQNDSSHDEVPKVTTKTRIPRDDPASLFMKFKHLMDGPLDGTGMYRCKQCNKVLKNLYCFKSHAKRHFEFEFLCESCGQRFVNAGMLRRHCMTHHGAERTSRCPHCDYGAIDNLQLKVHIRREHTGDRPFVCDACGASFRSRPHLIHHLAVHQVGRPVQCPTCPATFKSRQHLATHLSKVHRSRGWRGVCYVCNKTYSKSILVRRHIARHHAIPLHQQKPIQKVLEAT